MGNLRQKKTLIKSKLILLREKLFLKSKKEKKFKFYTLYGLIYRADVLQAAWKQVERNGGAAGVDGQTIDNIKSAPEGVEKFLKEIERDLREKTYKPQPVKRVYIPKPNGKLRPLGIPTIKDRVVQMATILIIEPIFEADFLDCSYGFRPNKNAHQAVREVEKYLKLGYREIYDVDLLGYFDSIPHDKLIKCVEMRIADRHVIKLIRMWLKSAVVETDKDGKKKISHPKQGSPAGGVISPLLANLYLHWFDKVFHKEMQVEGARSAKLIRYCDDFVIMQGKLKTKTRQFIEDKLENWLGLKINKEKTRIIDMKKHREYFSFLGFSFRYNNSKFDKGKKYLDISPKRQAITKARENIRQLTNVKQNLKPYRDVIKQLNQFLVGWGQYFALGNPSKSFQKINHFVGLRLYRHLLRRSQRRSFSIGKGTWYQFYKAQGLVMLNKKMFGYESNRRSL